MDNSEIQLAPDTCPSCGNTRTGKFCVNCGEKRISSSDFSLKKYLLTGIDAFTHFEGKFFKSFKYLLFYPGELTKNYLEGKRVKLMKPPQLYIIVAVAFFFFFKHWDIFHNKTVFYFFRFDKTTEQFNAVDPLQMEGLTKMFYEKASQQAAAHHQNLYEYSEALDQKLENTSRAFVFMIIPLLAVFLFLTGFIWEKRFMPHLVHATHLFTFLLAIGTIWMELVVLVYQITGKSANINYNYAFAPPLVIFLLYTFFSLRKAPGVKNILTRIALSLILAFGLAFSTVIYRIALSAIGIWLS